MYLKSYARDFWSFSVPPKKDFSGEIDDKALNFAILVFSMKKSTEEKTKNVEVIAEVQGPQVLPVM